VGEGGGEREVLRTLVRQSISIDAGAS
jgi:hypothetical protein